MLTIDLGQKRVTCDGQSFDSEIAQALRDVPLSPIEWAVLEFLAQRQGDVVPAEEIVTVVWPQGVIYKAVKIYIKRVRDKLGPEAIVTHRGMGYRLADAIVVIDNGQTAPVESDPELALELAQLYARHLAGLVLAQDVYTRHLAEVQELLGRYTQGP